MKKEDFYDTKWDVREWTDEMKTRWQEKVFELGFDWDENTSVVRHVDRDYYYLDQDLNITYGDTFVYFEEHNNTEKHYEDVFPEESESSDVDITTTKWTGRHYDNWYTLTDKDIQLGKVKIDAYFVNKMWKLNEKDDTGALFHSLKTIARFGDKNSIDRELKALYNQTKRMAELYDVDLGD